MATNYNAPGPWNNFNPVGKYTASSSAMPSGNDRAAYEKKMADVYSNVKVGTDLFGNSIKGYTGTSNNSTGVNQSRAGINAPGINSRPTGGNLSFSLGGGRGGGGGSSAPSNVLTPQTFAPYESTYTPPTPATPIPYDYATRDPYIYGDGLSNAGAAYDIWGSKPGTNPYLLTTPADYTPGIIGLDPVTLPNNMPNKGADISAFKPTRKKFTGTPEQIVKDYGYTGRTVAMQNNVPPSMRDSAPNAQVMLDAARKNVEMGRYNNMQEAMNAQQAFNLKYPTLTKKENERQIALSQNLMKKNYVAPPKYGSKEYKTAEKNKAALAASRNAFKNSSGPMPGQTTYKAKKTSTAKAVKKYTTKDMSSSYKARKDVRNLFA